MASEPPPAGVYLVGNDVVDLSHPRCREMPLDGRFVARVLAEEEHARIAVSPEPRRTLWRIWAAKEAAYKVVSKLRGSPPPFVHAHFLVRGGTADERTERGAPHAAATRSPGKGGPWTGTVSFEELRLPVRESPGPSPAALHVVSWLTDSTPALEAGVERLPHDPPPLHRLGERERAAVHSAASGWVRLRARARAAHVLGLPEADLEIVCDPGPPGRSVPRLLVGGEIGPWDVSLSHHGDWIAWALGRPRRGSGPQGRKWMSSDVPKRE